MDSQVEVTLDNEDGPDHLLRLDPEPVIHALRFALDHKGYDASKEEQVARRALDLLVADDPDVGWAVGKMAREMELSPDDLGFSVTVARPTDDAEDDDE